MAESPQDPLLSRVRGQDTVLETLRRAYERDRLHHAYLFEGPGGVGKETVAFGLAQLLVCERQPSREPGLFGAPESARQREACGACRACLRAIPDAESRRPLHPDVVVLERGLYDASTIGRRTAEATELSIDQVRTLVLARSAFSPHEGRAKVFIVRRAEELSISAANALLKTLEEPGAATHFILLSDRPDALLPTIRSRTSRLRFARLSEEIIVDLLVAEGHSAKEAAEWAKLAEGSVGRARELATDPSGGERRAFVDRALAALAAPHDDAALTLAEDSKKHKGDLEAMVSALVVEAARRATSATSLAGGGADEALRIYDAAQRALRHLRGNVSAQLVVEGMLLALRREGVGRDAVLAPVTS